MNPFLRQLFAFILFCWPVTNSLAQDSRTQFPALLRNAYFGVNTGYINYKFSRLQLEPGFQASSIHVPHFAVGVVLFGYRFNEYLSGQITYMRPAAWVEYKNVNGSQAIHKVGMNIAGLTLRSSLPLSSKFNIYGEGGMDIVTRGGFIIGNSTVVKDASFTSILLGTGLSYKCNKNWELMTGITWSPKNKNQRQPATVFYSVGFNYLLGELSAAKVERNTKSNYHFPRQVIQLGVASNIAGYSVNHFFSKTLPVFWGGTAHVRSGITLQYQRNIFHGRKVFAFDIGTTAGVWQSRENKERFLTLTAFPVFRFTFWRTPSADLYFDYSLAGPSFISKVFIDGKNTGKKFTFQDFMGIGVFAGKKRQLNAAIRIAHYSNGNIFPHNDGVKVPLSLNVGYGW